MVELVRSPRQADNAEAESFCCEQLRTEHAGSNSSSILTINGTPDAVVLMRDIE